MGLAERTCPVSTLNSVRVEHLASDDPTVTATLRLIRTLVLVKASASQMLDRMGFLSQRHGRQ